MTLVKGVLALLEATPGKEAEVEGFLKAGQTIAEQEPGTKAWYAFQVNESTFGIFDAFADEDARHEHLTGKIPAALGEVGPDLLATEPDIRLVDVLAVKNPS
jgi:quinol monooxygenase YgiN